MTRHRSSKPQQMAELHSAGHSFAAIGRMFNCSRVNVWLQVGKVTNRDREEASLQKRGCSYAQYCSLRDDPSRPTLAFSAQRRNARMRAIPWEFNLWQWWTVWQESGKWNERARGSGYVMCRKGDTGPYAVGNVYIATSTQNIRDGFVFRRRNLRCAASGVGHES